MHIFLGSHFLLKTHTGRKGKVSKSKGRETTHANPLGQIKFGEHDVFLKMLDKVVI